MKTNRNAKVAALLLLGALFCTLDLGINLLYNAEPTLHDGSLMTCSVLHGLFGIFGDSLWSFDRFFSAFQHSAWVSFGLLCVNVGLQLWGKSEK